MGRIKSFSTSALPLSIMLLMSHQARAAEIFGGAISADSLMSNNTTKSALEPIEERQDIYKVALTADYTNWLVDLAADYQFSAQKFAEQSQDDEKYLDGSAALIFGKEQDPFGLELSHSQRMLLQTPDAVDLVENMDERQIISAAPIVRTRIFAADTLFLRGEVSQVNFLDDDEQDSKRNSANLGWTHPLSATDILSFTAQQTNVEFDQQPLSDYALANAMFSYAVQLRKLNYRVEIGYNETSPEVGEKEGEPAYKAELGYDSGYHNLSASFSQYITDTSFGDGNAFGSSDIPDGDGLTEGLDLLSRNKVDVSWSTDIICGRCSFSLSAGLEDDDYLSSDESSLNLYARSAFLYSLSNAASVEFRADRSKYDFEGSEMMGDYGINYFSIKYAYRFANGIDIDFFARKEDRESDVAERSYTENSYGAGLSYYF